MNNPVALEPILIAHLDLKGLQQLPHLVLEEVDRFARFGYRALLVEYEDVFPYRSADFSTAPNEVWSSEFLEEFLSKARACGLEVIPLQQTLGHLEYALRWDVHTAFRMPVGFPSTLHLGSETAKSWLKALLVEMIQAHPDSQFIHLGMDEARSLSAYAKSIDQDPLAIFLEYLEELCAICEQHRKTPIIWSDMLEDHLRSVNLSRICEFRERVILACWDYTASSNPSPVVRFSGRCCSRYWLTHPDEDGAPRLKADTRWIEEWPEEIRRLAAPYQVSETCFKSLFQAAIWKDLGFRVWGAGAAATSEDGLLLPLYHQRIANLECWQKAVEEWQLDGLIVTAWARAQTCSPPGILPDLNRAMFLYAVQNRCVEDNDGDTFRDLFLRIGRCRENWWIERELLLELERQFPPATLTQSHWHTLILMLRIQAARRAIDMASYQAERYLCGDRLPASEWEQRLAELQIARQQLADLRGSVCIHLEALYFGTGLDEWLSEVFDSYLEAADALTEKIVKKRNRAAVRFLSRRPGGV